MRRLFWMSVGAAGGIYAVRRVTRTVHTVGATLGPSGLATAVASVGDGLRALAVEIRTAMTEREVELREALGIPDTPSGV